MSISENQPISTPVLHPETAALHAGFRQDPATNAVAVPIYQTTSYEFGSTDHAANLFGLAELGNIYTRIMNPTTDVLEKRLAAIEGGVAALAVASGQVASAYAVQNLAVAGDNIVSSTDIYGGTWNLFKNTLAQQGIEVRFVDPSNPANFAAATDERTRAYYAETLPNPKLEVFPIQDVSDIGRPLGIPLIIDNTAAPLLARPFDHGAAIVIHSLTKYIGGHGTSIGGIIIDGGNFDWGAFPERQPALNQPDPSYHGAVWAEAATPLGPIAYVLKARVILLRDLGIANMVRQEGPIEIWQYRFAECVVDFFFYPTSQGSSQLVIKEWDMRSAVIGGRVNGGKCIAAMDRNHQKLVAGS